MGAFLFLWVAAICCRLVYLQIFKYGDYVQKAARQHQRTIDVDSPRGIIYDRNGRELAMSVNADSVFAVPSEIPDPESTARILSRILKSDPDDVLNRLKSSRSFAWIGRKLDQETSDRIHALNLRGIYFEKEPKRYYPKRELAAQVLGYVGMDGDGLAGVERQFETQLRGRPGQMLISMDARRKWFGRIEKRPDPGANVVLTIDEMIQYIAEKELDAAITSTGARAGTIVIQNPRTGEILALANRPTFNPNLSKGITPSSLKNHALSDIYEPGSVFKTVTYSAALEEKLTTPEEMVDCNPGFIIVGGIRIRDSHHISVVPVEKAYAESSDVAAVRMGLRLGPERFHKYIKAFGFGQQTGIELPGETRGLVKNPSRWTGSSVGSISIGQEVGVTPVQIVSMVSAIANDGVYTPPRLVADVTAPRDGYHQIVFKPAEQRRVISSLTAARMRKMMESVVMGGTARRAILDGYTSAGKTGTAQKIDPKTRRYSRTDYVASFAGFAPVNNAAVSVAVILDSPKGLHQGGQVSAPVFNRVTQQVLEYLNVPHDAEFKKDLRRQLLLAKARDADWDEELPDRPDPGADLSSDDGTEQAAVAPPVAPVVSDRGNVPRLVPAAVSRPVASAPGTPVQIGTAQPSASAETPARPSQGSPVVLDVTTGAIVPSLLGKTLRGAIETAQQHGIEIEAVGSGIARQQFPPPGSRLQPGRRVEVRFSR